MYAGSGNKITIKRKAAAVEDTDVNQPETDGTSRGSSVGGVKCIPSSQLSYGTTPKKSSKGSKVNFHYWIFIVFFFIWFS